MIIAYVLSNKKTLERIEIESGENIPHNTIWIDLLEPSRDEETLVERTLKIDAPTREEMDKIEMISPFYKEGSTYYATITGIHKTDKEYPEDTALTFILHSSCLVTLRYAKPKAFSYFSNRSMKYPKLYCSPDAIFEGLIESIVHSVAEVLEKTGNEIDQLLIDAFNKPKVIGHDKRVKKGTKQNAQAYNDNTAGYYYTNIIKRVGRTGNLVSKIKESLVSINRMLIFLNQIEEFKYLAKKENRLKFRNLSREVYSLTEYATFVAQRNSFLLEATLGMINVEQNIIIKGFTVAATVFLPPTLIASIYGMNFHNMPELDWAAGYPFALLLIVLSAVLPYLFFKKKGLL